MNSRVALCLAMSIVFLATTMPSHADSNIVDKIYHPYVQPLERELEWRTTVNQGRDRRSPVSQTQRLGFGSSITDSVSGEFYIIGQSSNNNNFSVDAYELESQWQLTEQGQYAIDWGALFELERNVRNNSWESATSIIAETAAGRWSATANLSVIYEASEAIQNEWESRLSLQARYRWSPGLEPAIEFYDGQNRRGLGPVLKGSVRLGGRRKLLWEAGVIFGLVAQSPDRAYRTLFEYEF